MRRAEVVGATPWHRWQKVRDEQPFVSTNLKTGHGPATVAAFIEQAGELDCGAAAAHLGARKTGRETTMHIP